MSTISLNSADTSNKEPTTVVVFGAPRGGTTMLAGVVQALGVDIGTDLPANLEDPAFNLDLIKLSGEALPVERIRGTVLERNQSGTTWGWKYPAAGLYLERLQPSLRNPRYLCIFRDPLALALRPIHENGREPLAALERATVFYRRNLELLSGCGVPALLLSYEKVLRSPEQTVDTVAEFVGVKDGALKTKALESISREGGYPT